MQGAAELHVLHQVGALALVGRDDADLVRLGARLQQLRGDLLHVCSLRPKKVRLSLPRLHLWAPETPPRLEAVEGSGAASPPVQPCGGPAWHTMAGQPSFYQRSQEGQKRLTRGLLKDLLNRKHTLKR